jgi:hypothetical protein
MKTVRLTNVLVTRFAALWIGAILICAASVAHAGTPYADVSSTPAFTSTGSNLNVQATTVAASTANLAFPTAPIALPLVTTLDGKPFDIASDKGYKVVYFYSNACPCVRNCETLTFKPLSQQYLGKVSFYAVVSGGWDLHDDHANFMSLLSTHHLPFPVLLDTTHGVADALGGIASSQAVLLSPDDRILFDGAADDSKEYTDLYGHLGHTKTYLADAIAEALAGKSVTLPYVHPRGCSIAK